MSCHRRPRRAELGRKPCLYSFPTAKQGYLPNGNLVFDSVGNLYGATMFGGGYGTTCDPFYQYCGAVFELSPPKKKGGNWAEKVLHGFKAGTDGANPNGGLVIGTKGAIYGTTSTGGFNCPHHSGQGCGTAFKLTPTTKSGSWGESILHRFKAAPDGSSPAAGVIFDGEGELYGTTEGGGGGNSSGTVFKLIPNANGSWTEHILYSFQDGNDGGQPRGSVVLNTEGDIYGTASIIGSRRGGTMFRLRPGTGGSWDFAVLYDFAGDPDAGYPVGDLVFGKGGDIFGVTQLGGNGQNCGTGNCGTVFAIQP